MRQPIRIIAVLGLCLAVVGCENKCDSVSIPFLEPAAPDIASDPVLAPLAASLDHATSDVERLAVVALLATAIGRLTPDDANAKFDNTVARVAKGEVEPEKVTQMLDALVEGYLNFVQDKTRGSTTWPASRDPETWAIAAALQISVAKAEIKGAKARGAIPLAAIRHLARAEGWARGEETTQNDPLAGYDAMVERGVAVLSDVPPPQGP